MITDHKCSQVIQLIRYNYGTSRQCPKCGQCLLVIVSSLFKFSIWNGSLVSLTKWSDDPKPDYWSNFPGKWFRDWPFKLALPSEGQGWFSLHVAALKANRQLFTNVTNK